MVQGSAKLSGTSTSAGLCEKRKNKNWPAVTRSYREIADLSGHGSFSIREQSVGNGLEKVSKFRNIPKTLRKRHDKEPHAKRKGVGYSP